MNKLTLQYQYDASFFAPKKSRDDFGRLSLAVETERFSGKGGFWVQWQDVKEFGEALSVYPIEADRPVVGQWGFDMQDGDDLILRLEIAPANTRGDLAVRFEIADDYEPRHRVRGSFMTQYSDLSVFSVGVARVMNREVEEAVLTGM
jgi:predicted membrane-bound spermidine synthase